jgi:hypothetical protein
MVLNFYRRLPLALWRPTADDISLLREWMMLPQYTKEAELARLVVFKSK